MPVRSFSEGGAVVGESCPNHSHKRTDFWQTVVKIIDLENNHFDSEQKNTPAFPLGCLNKLQ
jgi:hypothetical protein